MENNITWEKGMKVFLVSSTDNEDTLDLKYTGRNNFVDLRTEKNVYFNEALFPYAKEGSVIYLDNQVNHVFKPYEILTIN